MKKSKTLQLVCGTCVSAFLLLGCSSDDGTESVDDSTSSVDVTTEESTTDSSTGDNDTDNGNSTVQTYPHDFTLVDTGQAECFDEDGATIDCPSEGENYYGQDAQYEGYPADLVDNGDGTVTDNITGLTWQQTPENEGRSWYEAEEYCASLSLSNYEWRLPTTKELFSLSDFTQGWPYIDTDYFDLAIQTDVTKDEQYWAGQYVGTTVEGQNDAAFGVNHVTGHIKAYAASVSGQFGNYTRCVSGNEYGVNAYTDNGDGTVSDYATNLMWAQADSVTTYDWRSALEYAENSELAGYSDWRLPNIRELQSIVDYTKSPTAVETANYGPAIDTAFFDISHIEDGVTNTNDDYGYAWSSTSAYFSEASPEYYYAWYVAFGTAVNDDGDDFHGAGAVRFDTKVEGGPAAEEAERYYNFVRLVRDID